MRGFAYLENARKTMQAYEAMCKPLCGELSMPQTAVDILLFLANNPGMSTAKDVVEVRRLKANHVSINVEKLVKEGYLERSVDSDDRRRVLLRCTEKAEPVIRKGRALQERFFQTILTGVTAEEIDSVRMVLTKIAKNIDEMRVE